MDKDQRAGAFVYFGHMSSFFKQYAGHRFVRNLNSNLIECISAKFAGLQIHLFFSVFRQHLVF